MADSLRKRRCPLHPRVRFTQVPLLPHSSILSRSELTSGITATNRDVLRVHSRYANCLNMAVGSNNSISLLSALPSDVLKSMSRRVYNQPGRCR